MLFFTLPSGCSQAEKKAKVFFFAKEKKKAKRPIKKTKKGLGVLALGLIIPVLTVR